MSEPRDEDRPSSFISEGSYDADQVVKAATAALARGEQTEAITHLLEAIRYLSDELESHADRLYTMEVNGAPI